MENTKVEHYLKACVPLIYVRTTENGRAVRHVTDAMEKANLNDCWIGEWSVNKGLFINGEYKADIETMSAALTYLTSATEAGALILHNVRQFISNFMSIQDLVDAAMLCRLRGSYIILVGTDTEFPPELRDLVTIYDFPLPDKEFFIHIFSSMVDRYRSSMKLPKGKKEEILLIEKASDSALGMTQVQGENALALSFVKTRTIDLEVIYAEKEQAIKQSEVLELVQTSESSDTLGGFDLFKPWLLKRKNAFGIEAREYGLRPPRGLLLAGVPGCGKSLCVKTIASTFEVPLIRFDIGKVFRSLQGQSESFVRQALRVAEAVAPCCLWIDEMEKSMAGAESSGRTDSGTTARIMQTVLTWMQEKTSPVYVAATVNKVDAIPPELMRKGRFDEIFGVDLPTAPEREEIFKIHILKRGRKHGDYGLGALADKSNMFTGAEIEASIDDAMATAFSDNIREFTTKDILDSIKDTVPQSESQREKITNIRDWIANRTRLVSSGIVPKWNIAAASEVLEGTRKVRGDND